MITNELYEGSVDLSIDRSRDVPADGACGYDPVSVTHEGTCRAPPPGNQTTTTMTAAKSTTTTKIQMNKQTNKNVYCIGLSLLSTVISNKPHRQEYLRHQYVL